LDLPLPAKALNLEQWKDIKEQALAKAEQAFLESALKQHQGDVKKTAEDMGITSRAVYTKLKKYGVNLAKYRRLTG